MLLRTVNKTANDAAEWIAENPDTISAQCLANIILNESHGQRIDLKQLRSLDFTRGRLAEVLIILIAKGFSPLDHITNPVQKQAVLKHLGGV